MSEAPEPKRPRLEPPELSSGERVLLQRTAMKPNGDLWLAHDLVMLEDGSRVSMDGSPPHGSWYVSSFRLTLSYQCPLDDNTTVDCMFLKMLDAVVWVQVRCGAEMQCILVRPETWS